MKIEEKVITKINITEVEGLDPIGVVLEDLGPRQGKIAIDCYGQSWTAYWGGMGPNSIAEFFCSCDEHYLAKKLSSIADWVYDIDAIRKQAEQEGIECYRDDPWNDYEFMAQMYGNDMQSWHFDLPTKSNPDYQYLCKIINAVKAALKNARKTKAACQHKFYYFGDQKKRRCVSCNEIEGGTA